MKTYIYVLVFVLMLSGVAAADFCGSTCLDNVQEIYSTHTLYGGDNAIMQEDTVVASSLYDWQLGKAVDFSLEFDPVAELLIYTIDGNVLQVKVASEEFDYVVLQGQTSFYGSNSMVFTDVMMDGKDIADFTVTSGIEGVKINPAQKFFKLEGKVTMNADGNTNKNMAGMNIYLVESKGGSGSGSRIASVPELSNGEPEIPEFGVVAAVIGLAGAIAVFAFNRKK